MESYHNVVIILIIAAIIILQFYVFLNNYKKIKDYKKTIEKIDHFEVVEVEVPEEWIKNIEVDDILKDRESFEKLSSTYDQENEESYDELNENETSEDIKDDVEQNDQKNES